jgi:hypothetical protein
MLTAVAVHNWEMADARARHGAVRLLPSLTDFAFLLPSFLLFYMMSGSTSLLHDGDTGWHIRTGEWILQHGAVPKIDLFSFTKPQESWFAWEWGWDVLFASIHRGAGLAGVVFGTILLLSFISALLFRLIRRYSDSDIVAFALTVLAICGSIVHWLARPHLVSWLFVLIFSHVILSGERGNTRGLYALPALMCIWVNVHGAFFVGIVLLGTTAIAEILLGILRAEPLKKVLSSTMPFATSTLLCTLATLVNPYGWHLHQHILAYLRDSKLLDNISEYQSISFHEGPAIFFEGMLLLGITSLVWCIANRKLGAALSIVIWAHLALVSGRNIPFFLLIAAPPIACMLKDALCRLEKLPVLTKLGLAFSEIADEFRPLERIERWHPVSAAGILAVALLLSSNRPALASKFYSKSFPVTAVPKLERMQVSRLFTYDQWADYLIYQRYPSQKVFIDGRSDFYGSVFLVDYQHIVAARYDCEALLKRYAIDAVLIRPDEALATVLKQSRDWVLLFDDGKAAIFQRTSGIESKRPKTGALTGVNNSQPFLGGGTGLWCFTKTGVRGQQLITQERRCV